MSSFRPRTFGEYFEMIWRRRLLLLVVSGLMLISTFVVIAGIPDVYQSSATVVVAGQQEDRSAVSARVATITERINSRAFLEPLIQRHNLFPNEVAGGRMEQAVNRLRRDIKIEAKYRGDNPETLTIASRSTDPQTAKDVATDVVSTFGRMNEAVEQQMDERGKQIASELSEIDNRLNQLGQQRAAAAVRSRYSSNWQGASSTIRAQRAAAQSSFATLGDKQYALEQQIAEQKRQIAEQEKIARSAPTDARSGSSYGVLLVRKAELEAQLKDYSSQYTDKNPKVIQARTQIAEINHQIAQLNTATGQDGVPLNSAEARELRAMQRELSRMETELAVVKRESDRTKQVLDGAGNAAGAGVIAVSAPPPSAAASAPIANIASETDNARLRDRYNALLRQQDEVAQARSAAAGLDPGMFQIVDLPVEPRAPVGPDRLKLRLFALALALVAGLLAVAVVEIPRLFAVRDARDVRYYLGPRVIALIPETVTAEERGRRRRLLAARALGVLLLAFALVPGLVLVLNQSRIFQIIANRW